LQNPIPKEIDSMQRSVYMLTAALLSAATLQSADTKNAKTETPVDATAAFARLKSLVGEWQADTQMGKVRLTYELIAGGTALVERETGEKMPEMMTVYYFDGKRLLLTHYCMAGNQPRMQAVSYNAETGELKFRFLDATNLAGPAAGHMHNAAFRFLDDGRLVSDWQFYENGQLKMTESAHYSRVR
jgi:hypothetical protein